MLILYLASATCIAQDTAFLKVHFLYGSKPKREFRSSERKWFGGMLGGHVGVESHPDQIVNFMRGREFHWIAKAKNKQSRFTVHTEDQFYSMFRGTPDSVKKAIIYVPVTEAQRLKFDSLVSAYVSTTPYDYAFIGMRCGSAAYDMLARIGVLKEYSYRKTYRRIFYPRRLRKRLLKKAHENQWKIVRGEGTSRRKWEREAHH